MKILVITQKYNINDSNLGAFIDWWDRLSKKFKQIYILALEKQSMPAMSNMEVISMGKERGVGFLGKIYGFYSGLFKVIGKTDAILVHMIPKYVIMAAPVAFFYRKPIYMWYTGHALHWELRLAVFFCRKVFTAHGTAMRVNTPKRIVTGHGIDTEKFKIQGLRSENGEPITILSIGRITPSKNHDLVIKAITDLIKAGYDIKLKIIGDVIQKRHQKYYDYLKKLSADSGVGDCIEFTGAVLYEKMSEHFANAKILINAVPFFGGLDKVVLEAMATGITPLTSNNAFLSVFPKEIAAHLVFKEYNLEDLKEKLKYIIDKKLYKNEMLRRELREVIVKNHNLNSLIDRIIKEMN